MRRRPAGPATSARAPRGARPQCRLPGNAVTVRCRWAAGSKAAATHRAALVALAACLACAQSELLAQPGYPARPVRLIAPFPPGGSSDLIARVLAQRLTESLPYPVLIDNRPGAGSNLGTQLAARAAPDGHTLLLGSVTNAINATL